MDARQIPRQVMDFNKTAFDNVINAMTLLESQTEKYAAGFIDKATWLPDSGKKAMNDIVKSYKAGFEGLKTASEENFKMMAGFLDMAQKSFSQHLGEGMGEDTDESDASSSSRRRSR